MQAPTRRVVRKAARAGVRALGALLLAGGFGLSPAHASATASPAGATRPRPSSPMIDRAPRPIAQGFRIVAFGSSSTQGVGASAPAFAYPAQVERLFDEAFHARPSVTVTNRGVGGEDIDDMMRRLGPDVLSAKPNLVIWQVGSNDPLRGVPLEHFKKLLRAGVTALRTSGAEVMLMEPQWCPALATADASGQFVEAVRAVGAEQHVDVVRRTELMRQWLAEGLVTERALVGPDGLHMTDRGYALLAKAVFDEVSATSPALRGLVASVTPSRHL